MTSHLLLVNSMHPTTFLNAYVAAYRAEMRKRRSARVAIGNAIRDRRMVRGRTCACGAPAVHGHHPDYDRPLLVEWVCLACHRAAHAKPTSFLPLVGVK